jgi:hypothetical protein
MKKSKTSKRRTRKTPVRLKKGGSAHEHLQKLVKQRDALRKAIKGFHRDLAEHLKETKKALKRHHATLARSGVPDAAECVHDAHSTVEFLADIPSGGHRIPSGGHGIPNGGHHIPSDLVERRDRLNEATEEFDRGLAAHVNKFKNTPAAQRATLEKCGALEALENAQSTIAFLTDIPSGGHRIPSGRRRLLS